MMATDLLALLVQETKQAIYDKGIAVATALGLPVTSWQPGDPTRSDYWYLAEILSQLELIAVEFVKAGFLDFAEGLGNEWLILLADQVYGVEAIEATAAATSVTLTNAGGGLYVIAAGDLTLRNSTSGATYHNTSGGTLSPASTLDIDVEADEAGSDGSSAAGEIDELVTTLLGVTCTNATAAVGVDAESRESIVDRCRDKLGSLSPNGPRDAYSYVARTPALSGTSAITRVRTYPDGGTGGVLVFLAGPSGSVAAADVTLAIEAINLYAAPLAVTPVVASANPVTIAVTYTIWLYSSVSKTSTEVQDAIESALETLFATRPIGGDVITGNPGRMYGSMILAAIRAVFADHAFRVTLVAPAGDTDIADDEVAVLGAVTGTVNFVEDP